MGKDFDVLSSGAYPSVAPTIELWKSSKGISWKIAGTDADEMIRLHRYLDENLNHCQAAEVNKLA